MSERVTWYVSKLLRAACIAVGAGLLYFLCAAQTAFAAITIGNTSSGNSSASALTFAHTVGPGSSRILIVGVSIDETTTVNVISSVTYGGAPLTNIGNTTSTGNVTRISLWRLVNPPSGTANIVVTPVSGNVEEFVAGATSYFGVNQTTPLGTFAQAIGNSGTPTVNVASATNDLVVDAVAVEGALLGNSISVGAGQSQRYNVNTAVLLGGGMIGAGSTEPGAATVTMSWTQNGLLNGRWAIGAVPLKPAPPTIGKAFNPGTIGVDNTSVLTFTITNPNPATSLTGVAFADTYPAGLVNGASPSVSNDCGGTVTAAAGGASISLSGGAISTGTSTCTITVNVTSASAGTYNNTSGAVSSTNSGTGNTAGASLIVLNRPIISKNFAPDPILSGATSVLTITLINPNPGTAITSAAFTDTYPAQITNSASPTGATTCTGGIVTAPAGGSSVALSGGTVSAGGSCTVTANVTSATLGTHTNTISAGALTTTNAGASTAAATDTLTVTAPLTLVKSTQTFSDPSNGTANPKAIPGAFVDYSVVATNPGPGVIDNDAVFVTDAVPANTDMFVGDIGGAGSGPVAFTALTSGLTYTFTSLASATDDVSFSNDGGTTYLYTPIPNVNGVDPAVTHIRINPKGTFTAASSCQLQFRVRVK